MSAGSVVAARPEILQAGGGATPTSALQSLQVAPIPIAAAKNMVEQHHYLHSLPGGTSLAFGVFITNRLMGAVTLGVGPANVHRLVQRAFHHDCLTLTRFWLADELPPNSESRVLGIVLRALRDGSSTKFIVSYADPAAGHIGTIYQATGWLYTGLSEATPRYDIGDGVLRHSRTVSNHYGTRSQTYLQRHGIPLKLVPQSHKHRYIYFLAPGWRSRLQVQTLPYPQLDRRSQ